MDLKIQTIKNWLGAGSINIFGHPFSGKDTQGKILAEMFGGILIGGGDILRSHHDPSEIERVMASGDIIPSDFYLNMVLPYLSQSDFANNPLILSAVGRSDGEQEIIMKATKESGHPTKAVILLKLSDEEVWKRFRASQKERDRGNRDDDNREVLQTRLNKFQEKTMPVIDYYRKMGLLLEVDGTLPREEVTGQILNSLATATDN